MTTAAPHAAGTGCENCGPTARARQLWTDMRGLVEHEDSLVDHRLRWLFTFNGFLFAALGLSLSAESGLVMRDCEPGARCAEMMQLLAGLRYAIATAGALSSLSSLLGVIAAQNAVRATRSDYVKACRERDLPPSPFSPIGRLRADFFGVNSATWFPVTVASVWMALGTWVFFLEAIPALVVGGVTTAALLLLTAINTTRADRINDVRDAD